MRNWVVEIYQHVYFSLIFVFMTRNQRWLTEINRKPELAWKEEVFFVINPFMFVFLLLTHKEVWPNRSDGQMDLDILCINVSINVHTSTRFDETREEKDMRVQAARLTDAEKELWEAKEFDPSIFKVRLVNITLPSHWHVRGVPKFLLVECIDEHCSLQLNAFVFITNVCDICWKT